MKISIISFTKQGAHTCKKIEQGLITAGHECDAYGMETYAMEAGLQVFDGSLGGWTEAASQTQDVLIFVGACGIAVRAIAPYVKDKTKDPAIVVVDEIGKYAISLLSGHIGGANKITLEIAGLLGAEPIITTATDINGKFAVDEWAKSQNLFIEDMDLAKKISATILNGQTIGVTADYPIQGQAPKHLVTGSEANGLDLGFKISIYQDKIEKTFPEILLLTPRILTLGIGCRKGASYEAIRELLEKVFRENKISIHAIEKLCSIDLKKEEAGLLQLSRSLSVPFQVYSSEELQQVEGRFTTSGFVKAITGADNVCERAAVLGSGGRLIIEKQSLAGVTIAVAMRKEEYRWNQ